jgi:demethylmenaquinone methyltransferase/2-methoxy-6-polyprenyl-1,4-benzoquinol methylase
MTSDGTRPFGAHASGGTGNASEPAAVRRMFDRIAPIYDLMNSVMTLGLDARWRDETLRAAALRPGQRVLDVACGTGRLTLAAARHVGHDGTVVGLDVSPVMLEHARAAPVPGATTPAWIEGDALHLPFADASFDAVLIGFGLRNLADFGAGLSEMARVTSAGGRVAVLEIAVPRALLPSILYRAWFRGIVPLLGRAIGHGQAYRYLPDSLESYPSPQRVGELMAAAGLTNVRWRWVTGGMTTLHVGERAA